MQYNYKKLTLCFILAAFGSVDGMTPNSQPEKHWLTWFSQLFLVPTLDWGNPGNVGIENFGSSCFINASLQCLFKTEQLNKILHQYPFTRIKYPKNSYEYLDQETAEEFAQLHSLTLTPFDDSYRLTTRKLYSFVEALQESTQRHGLFLNDNNATDVTTTQHDATEFIRYMITILGQHYAHHGNNAIENLFTVEMTETRSCKACGFTITTQAAEKILNLSLLPEARKNTTLNDLFANYFKPEPLEAICPRCSLPNESGHKALNRDFFKITEILTYPPVLIIKLIRESFDAKTYTQNKRLDRITLPQILQLPDARYALYGFIQHEGPNFNEGHYIAYAKNYPTGDPQWHYYNDTMVTPIMLNNKRLSSQNNYLAFYQRIPEISVRSL